MGREELLQDELNRNKATIEIVKLLGENDGFEIIVSKALKVMGKYLNVTNINFLKLRSDRTGFALISEWMSEYGKSVAEAVSGSSPVKLTADYVPDSIKVVNPGEMPEEYIAFSNVVDVKACVTVPLRINGAVEMLINVCHNDADRVWGESTLQFINAAGQIIQSILSRRLSKNSMLRSFSALKEIIDNSTNGVIVLDRQSREILLANRVMQEHFMLTKDDASGWYGFYDESIRRPGLEDDLFAQVVEYYSKPYKTWFELTFKELVWVDGRKVILCIAKDVTAQKKYQEKIEQQANNDFLTGLYNRMRCEADIAVAVRDAERNRGTGLIMFIDLDDFKNINDVLGHRFGDLLLQKIAEGLTDIDGIQNSCYRLGGDEFIVLVTYDQYVKVNSILASVVKLFNTPWDLEGTEYYSTMSMGIVRFPEEGWDVNELIKKADIAMYGAKRNGKNQYQFYNSGTEVSTLKRLDIERNMRKAVSAGCEEFLPYVQPIINIDTKECIGGEVLVRWDNPEMGLLMPGEFLSLAESLGLIVDIGDRILECTCQTLEKWESKGKNDMVMHVNLSSVQMLQNNIVDKVEKCISKYKFTPSNLVLEIRENLALHDIERVKRIVRDLKALGVKIALDDFGTGYSSLSYVKDMAFDIIKVGQSFVQDIVDSEYAKTFVRFIAEISETINAGVCIEGVETSEQCELLEELGISVIQGYYFGYPMPIKEFEKRFLKYSWCKIL
ncbi:MAG: EAL domain-containing protein [Lachnospiraceae bacterium]|nr:EAL domain-containing protein [Lachnospiraceae bacterium]